MGMLASYYPPPWVQVLLWGSVTVLPLVATVTVVYNFYAVANRKTRWTPLLMGAMWLSLGVVMLVARDFMRLPVAVVPFWYVAHGLASLVAGFAAIYSSLRPARRERKL